MKGLNFTVIKELKLKLPPIVCLLALMTNWMVLTCVATETGYL